MTVIHRLDSNVLVYAFLRAPRDAEKARVEREWIAREVLGVPVLNPFSSA